MIDRTFNILVAFSEPRVLAAAEETKAICDENKIKFNCFLDSGAFAVKTRGLNITIDGYMRFLDDHRDLFHVYANLDVIDDPKGTARNLRIMEESGFSPLPVVQYGASADEVTELAKKYDYLAIGLGLGIREGDLGRRYKYLKWAMWKMKRIKPEIKIHGFAVTKYELMVSLPFYSVDSSTWVSPRRFGRFTMFNPITRKAVKIYRTKRRPGNYLPGYLKKAGVYRQLLRMYGLTQDEAIFSDKIPLSLLAAVGMRSYINMQESIRESREFILYFAGFDVPFFYKPESEFFDNIFMKVEALSQNEKV